MTDTPVVLEPPEPLEPTPIAADPDEPEPIVLIDARADDLIEAFASIDMHAIPVEPPPETDQMRLF